MTPPVSTAAATGRRVTAPARRRPAAPPRRRPVVVRRPARRLAPGERLLGWLGALPDHRLLDRLIGGRVWIVLIGTLLAGIVTMQLTLLRLNAGIGRAVERSAILQQTNAELSASISQLSDPQRIADLAAKHGWVVPPQGSPRFIHVMPGAVGAALANMRVPAPPAPVPAAPATPVSAAPTAATGTISGVSTTSTPTTTTTAAPATPQQAPAPTPSAPATAAAPAAGGPAAPQG